MPRCSNVQEAMTKIHVPTCASARGNASDINSAIVASRITAPPNITEGQRALLASSRRCCTLARDASKRDRPNLDGPARGRTSAPHPQVGTKERPPARQRKQVANRRLIDDVINTLSASARFPTMACAFACIRGDRSHGFSPIHRIF